MKILVVGSGGVGAAFAPIAARRDFYEHIVFADLDPARGQRVVDRYGQNGKFSAITLDATKKIITPRRCRRRFRQRPSR